MQTIKASLAHLLGNSLPLEAVRRVYSDLPAAKCQAVPPDFYLRVSEGGLAFLLALAQASDPGLEWAATAAHAVRPLLTPPHATDELR